MHSQARGDVELICDGDHLAKVVQEGILRAEISIDIATADFKAMLVPVRASTGIGVGRSRRAPSIVEHLIDRAEHGVEIRLLHAGVPSAAALRELRGTLPPGLIIRRCPRLHAKMVMLDARRMYLGSANLTGAGLGAKADDRRNFEWGVWTTSPALIDAAGLRFNAIWEGSRCARCGRRDVCPVPLEEPAL